MGSRRRRAVSSLLLGLLFLACPITAKEGDKNPMVSEEEFVSVPPMWPVQWHSPATDERGGDLCASVSLYHGLEDIYTLKTGLYEIFPFHCRCTDTAAHTHIPLGVGWRRLA